jgi:hypothetical protein
MKSCLFELFNTYLTLGCLLSIPAAFTFLLSMSPDDPNADYDDNLWGGTPKGELERKKVLRIATLGLIPIFSPIIALVLLFKNIKY